MESMQHQAGYQPKKTFSQSTLVAVSAIMMIIGVIIGMRSDQIIAAVAPVFGAKVETGTLDLSNVQQTYRQLKANYDGNLDINALINGASRGMVAAAGDPYTVYMDKNEADEFNKELSGDVGGGIGAEIGVRSGQPTIVRILAGNPAEAAGIKAGDVLMAVGGESTNDYSADKAASLVRGAAGSTVTITVKRGVDTKEFTITRQVVSNPSVTSSVAGGIGTIKISRFDQQTGELARQAALSCTAQHVRGVILDLRDNGGGYVDAAQAVAGLWLASDKLVVTEKTADKVVDSLNATGDPILKGIKTIVLVNGSTASASEIVSGALKEYGVATLIGEKTFGKGTVQEQIKLPGGALLKVTMARWFTPQGKNITKEGIQPNQTVPLTVTDVDAGNDPQMDAAIQALK